MTRRIPQISHIDAAQPDEGLYAVDTDWTTYPLLFLDAEAGVTEGVARGAGCVPITEVFRGQGSRIPPHYLDAWMERP